MHKSGRIDKLNKLVIQFDELLKKGALDTSSEETARTWVEDMLEIFGWNPRNPLDLDQEFTLGLKEKIKLIELDTKHERPDYVLKRGHQNLLFLDAKRVDLNLINSKRSAFQIKAYGWSSELPCSIVTNFKEILIYDCRPKPNVDDEADVALIHYIPYDQYINKFEILNEHLAREEVLKGKLVETYPIGGRLSGFKTLNEDFCDFLVQFRKEIANHIYHKNKEIFGSINFLSIITQVILNRIIFIRICEGKQIENDGLLLSLLESNNFWSQFKELSNTVFWEHYDGPLFQINHTINEIEIDSSFFVPFITSLYYPHPYKFDIIPIDLLSNIYDNFLSRVLIEKNGTIIDEYKKEYQQIQGAVTTPYYIVNKICSETMLPKLDGLSVQEILKLKIIDPACGSGSFLIECFSILESHLLKYFYYNKNQILPDDKSLFIEQEGKVVLSVELKRQIIKNCIYGVDLDSVAVEVTRMSLALKIFENDNLNGDLLNEIGLWNRFILEDVGANIYVGNSLVDTTIFQLMPEIRDDVTRIEKVMPFDWHETFPQVFKGSNGFDIIVGNPPYIEVKHYKEAVPEMHQFIKENYLTSKNHKVDISVPFIEKSIELLNDSGRLGFIVQKRFFKTQYGKKIRKLLDDEKVIETIIDFDSISIFTGRITYTSILVLNKLRPPFTTYYKIDSLHDIVNKINSIGQSKVIKHDYNLLSVKIKTGQLGSGPWNFDKPEVLGLIAKLVNIHGELRSHEAIKLHVGIQTLWDKAYHIRPAAVEHGLITGKTNISRKLITIEEDACCKLICNENFYPFRDCRTDIYAIFPYDIINNRNIRISFSKFLERFPKAANYLLSNEVLIKGSVRHFKDNESWHLFTRVQNHVSQANKKVIIPMTVKDAVATVDLDGQYYLDNANLTSLHCNIEDDELLFAIAAICNSTLFSVLARVIANPQSNNYIKLNKQFLEPIPFPYNNLINSPNIKTELYELSQKIIDRQQELKECNNLVIIPLLKKTLKGYWEQIDQLVESLYELNSSESELIRGIGRCQDRWEIF